MLVSAKAQSFFYRWFFLLLFCSGVAFANEFSLQLAPEKDNVLVGESIPITLTLAYPPEYEPCAWILTFFESNVPKEFLEALNLTEKLSKAARPEWRYVNYSTSWFPKGKRDFQEKTIQIKTTDKWPAGDYKSLIQILYRNKTAPSTTTDKYISQSFSFTVEAKKEGEKAGQ